ncbi:unnamed protein product, partial [Nippostrongylus brasiliensis]|uniref:Gag-Pol polyprotein n=1 Tax=Nippostrongylus brasiliensis TaxID=27835 RepID=A0A0N4XN72_NIPBR
FFNSSISILQSTLISKTQYLARIIQTWSNATPRLQHQEMEDFLRYKEIEARSKAQKAQ